MKLFFNRILWVLGLIPDSLLYLLELAVSLFDALYISYLYRTWAGDLITLPSEWFNPYPQAEEYVDPDDAAADYIKWLGLWDMLVVVSEIDESSESSTNLVTYINIDGIKVGVVIHPIPGGYHVHGADHDLYGQGRSIMAAQYDFVLQYKQRDAEETYDPCSDVIEFEEEVVEAN